MSGAEALAISKARVKLTPRPRLTAEAAVDYLDWIMNNIGAFPQGHAAMHMQAAELAIRTRATDAQAKDTQHTLVRDGIIEAP